MKKSQPLPLMACLLMIFSWVGYVHAQDAGKTPEQQEMDQIIEMMKQQGLDTDQIQQMQDILKSVNQVGAQQRSAKADREQQEFEAATAGHGTARIEMGDRRYELKVTKCEVTDSVKGVFVISARQAPGMNNAGLTIQSDGPGLYRSVRFAVRTETNEGYGADNVDFEFDGRTVNWTGTVADTNHSPVKKALLKLSVSCGAESVYYDKPSRSRPNTPNNVLTLYMGEEAHEFEVGYCSNRQYQTGNIIVDLQMVGTGSFRGSPASVLFLKGSWGEGSKSDFQSLDLILGELSVEQLRLSPFATRKEPTATSEGGRFTMSGQDSHFRGPAMSSTSNDNVPEFNDLSAIPEFFVTCAEL